MSYSIPTLLIRNLDDVFGENDPIRRRAAINEIFHENAVFCEPNGIHYGRDEIDRIAAAIKAFRYVPIRKRVPSELRPLADGSPIIKLGQKDSPVPLVLLTLGSLSSQKGDGDVRSERDEQQ